jgi:hypothetical protein
MGGADGGLANAVLCDPAGNLYGTAAGGTSSIGGGIVFELVRQ